MTPEKDKPNTVNIESAWQAKNIQQQFHGYKRKTWANMSQHMAYMKYLKIHTQTKMKSSHKNTISYRHLTTISPRTPASSIASRAAACSTVSSFSHPPCNRKIEITKTLHGSMITFTQQVCENDMTQNEVNDIFWLGECYILIVLPLYVVANLPIS